MSKIKFVSRESVTRNLSRDFSQPIRSGSEKAQRKLTDVPVREGPHSVGVWTLKTVIFNEKMTKS